MIELSQHTPMMQQYEKNSAQSLARPALRAIAV
jgi:hypothetical protein